MYEAAFAGELGVCQWLYEHGAAATARLKNNEDRTPLWAACKRGYLPIAKWLYSVGAAGDVSLQNNERRSPLHISCMQGYLDVAKWLYDVGAKGDLVCKDKYGATPFWMACYNGHLNVARWLLSVGRNPEDLIETSTDGWTPLRAAADAGESAILPWLVTCGAVCSGPDGHVDATLLQRDVPTSQARELLRDALHGLVESNVTFRRTILFAARRVRVASENDGSRGSSAAVEGSVESPVESQAGAHNKSARRASNRGGPDCVLALLSGHEATLLAMVASWVGIPVGRELRCAREARDIIDAIPPPKPSTTSSHNRCTAERISILLEPPH
jgi:hypothetical protein